MPFLGSTFFGCTLSGQNPASSRDLKVGIRAHEAGEYPEAIEHLERAVLLDPTSAEGHYYLASAYAWMCPDEKPDESASLR